MRKPNIIRLSAGLLLSVTLAALLGAQALSSVSTKRAPSIAVTIFPPNGLAREELAHDEFTARLTDVSEAHGVAKDVAGIAREAVRSEPLTPKALAILALSESDGAVKRDILLNASRLNRRDLALQGLVLQEHLSDLDYHKSIETLNQILRVHPEHSEHFFPVLANALKDKSTIPQFAAMLDGSALWHSRFLAFSIRDREAVPSLAILRQEIDFPNESLDRRLIAQVAATGDIEGALALLRRISKNSMGTSGDGILDWESSYPPFEWRLSEKAGFRAQSSRDLRRLELSVRPGQGGIIAARLIAAPNLPFEIRAGHRIAPADQVRDVRLQLICSSQREPFYDERFSRQGEGFLIETLPAGCGYLVISINARAWSGRSALSGTIDQIEIVELRD